MRKESNRGWIFLVLTMLGVAAFPRSDPPAASAASPGGAGSGEPAAEESRLEASFDCSKMLLAGSRSRFFSRGAGGPP
jgi:hypothetical protein